MMLTTEILDQMVQLIVSVINPSKVILFGSYAQNKASADSDVDFIVVSESPIPNSKIRRQIMAALRKALSHFRIAKDFLVYDKKEFAEWQSSANHVLGHALREGKLLYERS